ncbi:trifunctional dihydropteroate synthetase [Entomophthora muscae]|uniref:Trifunctional dihydropteroate synthetase n=1 Tax=Entomophthora muscae TaxID=34485 RepID=A0ACC2THE5_9FUNG|nr:trifunctional dihydropteroate synthetase [Entomophthora muscae]
MELPSYSGNDPVNELKDKLIVRGLSTRSFVGGNHWNQPKLQPITLDLTFFTSIEACGTTDQLDHSVSYSDLASKAIVISEKGIHSSDLELANKICSALLLTYHGQKVTVCIHKPSGLLHVESCGIEVTRTRANMISFVTSPDVDEYTLSEPASYLENDRVFIEKLRISAIIGIHPWERAAKQAINFYMTLNPGARIYIQSANRCPKDSREVVEAISKMIETSDFQTVEALATSISRVVIVSCGHPKITVRVEKPSALGFAEGAAAEISRDATFFIHEILSEEEIMAIQTKAPNSEGKITLIAVGTNLGNRYENISQALKDLSENGCKIIDTSFLYETAPMYIDDQPMFLNAVCKAVTTLTPEALLVALKSIEEKIGRIPTIRNGPRLIDLDILDYEGIVMHTPVLELPHPRIAEREFVLRPLCDMVPDWEHPQLKCTARQLLTNLDHGQAQSDILKVLPLPSGTVWPWGKKTYIMGILNVTPDSFSDGGEHDTVDKAVTWAKKMIGDGADILDIGGASTRPGAIDVSIEEETSRVIPVIKKLRAEGITCPISIDTFHAQVAKKAVQAGASIINDVTGGLRDPKMFEAMASAGVPVCLMHMRGDSKTMCQLNTYPKGQVMQTVQLELAQCLNKAISYGVYRWNVILDPGLGFAKDCNQNLELMRNLGRLGRSGAFPCLVGASRKRFLGEITGVDDPHKRVWATSAACTAAIAAGADILRVHDVTELRDVVLISDAIYRPPHF